MDVFGGSGSTLIAAEKTCQRACFSEFDEIYRDHIIARCKAYAKDEAEQFLCCWAPSADVNAMEAVEGN